MAHPVYSLRGLVETEYKFWIFLHKNSRKKNEEKKPSGHWQSWEKYWKKSYNFVLSKVVQNESMVFLISNCILLKKNKMSSFQNMWVLRG
jgi:hypothetical protein